MEHLRKIDKLLSKSQLTEADAMRFGRQIKRRVTKQRCSYTAQSSSRSGH